MIENYGSYQPLPEAAVQPDKELNYKIIYSIEKLAKKEGQPAPGLVHIARTINIYEWAGMPHDQFHLVGIVHGEATPIVLKNQAYQKHFQKDNPNLDLLHQLKQAGVKLYICGQSLLSQGYQKDDIAPEVDLALSALTVLPTYELKGYALLIY